jgi:primosomal protein N' (replication factor Y)
MSIYTAYVEVVVAAKTPTTFTYAVPEAMSLSLGDRVLVPFARTTRIGVVVGPGEKGPYRIKSILEVLDQHAVDERDLAWLDWLARYYHTALGLVYQTAFPSVFWQQKTKLLPPKGIQITEAGRAALLGIGKPSPVQKKALQFLSQHVHGVLPDALHDQDVSERTLQKILDAGWAHAVAVPMTMTTSEPRPYPLSADQASVISDWASKGEGFHVGLLHGVTGSGKTEFYCALAEAVLARGQQVLILVPEIGLTPQTVRRFQKRLGVRLGVWHSKLTPKARATIWLQAMHQTYDMVIGTRSAAFMPLSRLGLIIIDESHDASFKQQHGLRYLATHALMKRASHHDCPILLGTATPSLASLHRVAEGKMRRYALTARVGGGKMPKIQCVDMRAQKMKGGLSAPMLALLKAHLAAGDQVLVFLNRRGYAPTLLCHLCGYAATCLHCHVNMTVHKSKGQLCCHHCQTVVALFEKCPKCLEVSLVDVGVGTERVEEVLRAQFPEVAMRRIDRDTMTTQRLWDQTLNEIESGDLQLLIGTQMLAKGHHWPQLRLVAIVDVDAQLYSSDVMALERLGQTIWQVAGRAGRTGDGQVVLQTHWPDHPFFKTLLRDGYQGVAEWLLKDRATFHLPPYEHHARLCMRGRDGPAVHALLVDVQAWIKKQTPDCTVLGPYPEGTYKKSGLYHEWLWLRAVQRGMLHQAISEGRCFLEQHGRASMPWYFDIDLLALG